ncbi:dabb-domain-containing protein [Melanomma pulvis-pyrius CBS 109.77]|uniref:Dabb-domain-containing protein n=1 Tax=Melanomma pulvis-pyrius CBS 109.77 TaxID=1314802 RepID=A0A6A6X2A1_9PLEO|nr:dabb-domain-containing protein [Melanomma pulvis-pyrius CBS 109.77]
MGITHIVLFRFKSIVSPEAIQDVSTRFVALKGSCIHPTSNNPYIKSVSGGTDNSPEGFQGGITHAFVVEFESAEDRDYYVNDDPAHEEFKKLVGPFIEKAQVVDFTNGVFN